MTPVVQRSAALVGLLLVLFINIYIASQNHAVKSFMESNTPEKFWSTEYASNQRTKILRDREHQILKDLTTELKNEHEGRLLSDITHSLYQQFAPNYMEHVKSYITDKVTKLHFHNQKLNYELFNDLKNRYYQEHQDALRDSISADIIQNILQNEDERKLVTASLAKLQRMLMPRQKWLQFVLRDIIKDLAPKLGPLTQEERGPTINDCQFAINTVRYTKRYLSRVSFSTKRHDDMVASHSRIVAALSTISSPASTIYSGKGIVVSGGGALMGGALAMIIQTRETGSKLPIELILNTYDEYDEHICKNLGAKFGFRCVIIEQELGSEFFKSLEVTKFVYKILGLFVSSFDHTIALDADNMPIKNPDEILTSTAYTKTEFLLWPDLWQRTISPEYYDIVGIEHGELRRRNGAPNDAKFSSYLDIGVDDAHFHDLDGLPSHVSTETGQMVFSKMKHYRSFILALYYNVFGKDYYWPMFYQGSPGSGDRDTFVPALHVFEEPYHVVEHQTWLAGFVTPENQFQETTIVQYDPITSENFDYHWRKWLKANGLDSRLNANQNNDYTHDLLGKFEADHPELSFPEVAFLHVHRPKINPILGTGEEDYFEWDKQRNLGAPGAYATPFGKTDWELRFYTIAKWVACEGIKSPTFWKSVQRDQAHVCEKMLNYVDFLKEDSPDAAKQLFQHIEVH